MNVTWFPVLADAMAILDEYMPEMLGIMAAPHVDATEQWLEIRTRLDVLFAENGWNGDESRVAFDLLVAFAAYTMQEARA